MIPKNGTPTKRSLCRCIIQNFKKFLGGKAMENCMKWRYILTRKYLKTFSSNSSLNIHKMLPVSWIRILIHVLCIYFILKTIYNNVLTVIVIYRHEFSMHQHRKIRDYRIPIKQADMNVLRTSISAWPSYELWCNMIYVLDSPYYVLHIYIMFM